MGKTGIKFKIEVQTALHMGLSTLGLGEYQFTQRCLPGSALRGALAEVLLPTVPGGLSDQEFKRLFEGEAALRFEPAYPAGFGQNPGYPFPLTARRCKLHGGFPPASPKLHEVYHGVFDILVSQVVFEEQLEALKMLGRPLAFLEDSRCPHCDGGVEPEKGVFIWQTYRDCPGLPEKHNLERHTHTAINRARRVAEDQMLYTLETIEAGALFQGCVWVEEKDEAAIRDALPKIVHLGRGVTSGRGRVKLEVAKESWTDDVESRIKELTALFQAERTFYARLSGQPEVEEKGHYFTLDLLSPAILGEGGAVTLEPGDVGLPTGVQLLRRFTTPEIVGGWWTVAGLPYPTALASAAGSLFLYYAPPEVPLSGLRAALDQLTREGIGHYRERGYGAVIPCSLFHLWTAEKEAAR